MPHSLASQIRQRLGEYIDGIVSADYFAEWMIPVAMSILERRDEMGHVADLASEIDTRLVEYYDGDWTEAELRLLLAPHQLPNPYASHSTLVHYQAEIGDLSRHNQSSSTAPAPFQGSRILELPNQFESVPA